MRFRLTAVFIFVAVLAACAGHDRAMKERGAALLMPFKATLKNELVTSMKSGLDEAIAVCNTAAPAIAKSLSIDGVEMGRSSHKLRNRDNVAPEWLAPYVQKWADSGITNDEEVRLVSILSRLEGGRHGYAEPIFVQPLCLTCHGETLAPDVAAKIAELYPNDQATGFRTSDFRGVFWVEF